MLNLYYELTSDGYHIYDRNDPLFHIHQYEPYIPDHSKTYEQNAQLQMHEIMLSVYVGAVISGEIAMADVPEDYKAEVQTIVDNRELTSDEILLELEKEVGING